VSDGDHAMDFLLQSGHYADCPKPDLVLLDLNLPRRNGFQVLAEIKRNPLLRDIRVVVLSTSTCPHDRERATLLGAIDYLTKEAAFDAFISAAQSVCKKLSAED
jgi:CheY-like chemotaxis protein